MASPAEARIREKAVAMLRARGGRVIHELPLISGTIRIDLATVRDDSFDLVEIKSEKDVLTRLKAQIETARKLTRHVSIVFNHKHEQKILDFFKENRRNEYGCYLYKEYEDQEKLEPWFPKYFGGKHEDCLCSATLFKMLWAQEMADALRERNLIKQVQAHPPRQKMTLIAIHELSQKEIIKIVCHALKQRPFANADRPKGDLNE